MIYSCKKDEKTANKEKTHQNAKIDSTKIEADDAMATLFSFNNEDNTELVEISANGAGDEDKFMLGADKILIVVSKYKKNKEPLEIMQHENLLVSEFNYVYIDPHFSRKKIQGIDYFLFALMESPMGNGDPGLYLSFIMLNTNNLKFYILKYTGENTLRSGELVDGEFTKDKALESNIEIYNELYQFASKNKWVYKPSEEEKNINYYKNFEQKWYKDNDHDENETSDLTTIKSTYYTENLFQFNGNYDEDQIIENASFKIVNYFRNNVVGYDKNKKLYFPIIVESCATGCGKEIKFVSENEIEISYEMDTQPAYIINLNKIRFENTNL